MTVSKKQGLSLERHLPDVWRVPAENRRCGVVAQKPLMENGIYVILVGCMFFFLWFFSVRNRWDLDLMFFFYGNYDLFRVLQNIIQIVESQDWCSGHKWPNMRGVMTARLLQSDNSMWGPYMRYLHYGFRLHMMESVFHYVLGKNLTPPFSKVSNRRRA